MSDKNLIIGAGPIGLFLGSKIKNSTIIDSKIKISEKIRCTGVLTEEIKKILTQKELKKITLNEITQTTIIGPTKKLKTKIKKDFIIDNKEFENILYDKTLKNNNEIILNTNYIKSNSSKHTIKDRKTRKEKIIKNKKIIGIDGPNSLVAKQHNLNPINKKYTGLQVRMKIKNQENEIKFFPHIGVYAWYVPETENYARVGLTSKSKNGQQELKDFIKRFPGKIIEKQAGIIPLHRPFRKTENKNCVLLGDSAGQIKNTTGGGLISAMKSVENHLAKQKGKTKPHKGLRKELYSHFLVHNILKTLKQKEWDLIIEEMKKSPILSQKNRDDLLKWGPPFLLKKRNLRKIVLKKILSGQVRLR